MSSQHEQHSTMSKDIYQSSSHHTHANTSQTRVNVTPFKSDITVTYFEGSVGPEEQIQDGIHVRGVKGQRALQSDSGAREGVSRYRYIRVKYTRLVRAAVLY